MKYQCETCKKTFHYTARHVHFLEPKDIQVDEDTTFKAGDTIETYRCPYCQSKDFIEYVEPQVAEQKTTTVLVVDLVTGANLALNQALEEGYEIVGRYAKQYILEKKAPIIERDYIAEAKAFAEAQKQ